MVFCRGVAEVQLGGWKNNQGHIMSVFLRDSKVLNMPYSKLTHKIDRLESSEAPFPQTGFAIVVCVWPGGLHFDSSNKPDVCEVSAF